MHRRDFLQSLALALFVPHAILKAGTPDGVRKWVAAQDEIARQLVGQRITGAQWQHEVERLAKTVSIDELLDQVDFATLEKTMDLTHPGGTKHFVRLGGVTYGTAVFGLRKNYAITPHAHRNMVSAHMVVKGTLHVRNFDRVGDEPGHVIVEPTVDTTIRRGDVSTMSSDRNNVHWFTALTPTAFTLDVIMDGLTPNTDRYTIELLDVRNAARLEKNRRRARIIDWEESVRLYGVEG